ncbi:hypothetical protein M4Q70_20945, partial [Acidovorax valerianellae]
NRYWQNHTLQIRRPSISKTAHQINDLRVVQGGLHKIVVQLAHQPSQHALLNAQIPSDVRPSPQAF